MAGAAALLAFYLGLVTLAQGWSHATALLTEDGPFVVAIAAGFGLQVAFWRSLRTLHARVGTGGVAVGGGTGTVAMAACCAHHLADVLPLVGLAGAAVAIDLYKTPLLWVSIGMNLAGAAYLLRQILRHGRASPASEAAADDTTTLKEHTA